MDDIKKQIQTAMYQLMTLDPFYGNLMQEISLSINESIPTAGMGYNKKNLRFYMHFNPTFFGQLKPEERVAVIHHELLHFVHNHLVRFDFSVMKDHERIIANIAMDMAINQYITNLPEGCVKVDEWKNSSGGPLTPYKTSEYYYNELRMSLQNNGAEDPNKKSKSGKDFRDDFQERKDGQNKDEKGNPQWGTGTTKANDEKYDKHKQFDQHDWENLSDEEKQKYFSEMKNVVERTIEKSNFGHSKIPDFLKELLANLSAEISGLDYKGILRRAIKKSVTVSDRRSTWNRPNKRYGNIAPGTSNGELPQIGFYMDTSGSMSIREVNEAMEIMNKFMSVGAKQCHLGLWHTNLYHFKKVKLSQRVSEDIFQSGGTDVGPVLEHIKKTNPNLAIIVTDGFFDKIDIKLNTEVIWVIRQDCNLNHPNIDIGKTISYGKLKG